MVDNAIFVCCPPRGVGLDCVRVRDMVSLQVTSIYLRRLESEADGSWGRHLGATITARGRPLGRRPDYGAVGRRTAYAQSCSPSPNVDSNSRFIMAPAGRTWRGVVEWDAGVRADRSLKRALQRRWVQPPVQQ